VLSHPYILLSHSVLGGREPLSGGGSRDMRWRRQGAPAGGGAEDAEVSVRREALGVGGRRAH
jgi:hypothetical protein